MRTTITPEERDGLHGILARYEEWSRNATGQKAEAGQDSDKWHDEVFQRTQVEEANFQRQAQGLRELLASAEILVPEEQDSEVRLGSGVTVEFSDGSLTTFLVVGIAIGSQYNVVSTNSPLGQALVGKRKNRRVGYTVGEEKKHVKILEIFLPSIARSKCLRDK